MKLKKKLARSELPDNDDELLSHMGVSVKELSALPRESATELIMAGIIKYFQSLEIEGNGLGETNMASSVLDFISTKPYIKNILKSKDPGALSQLSYEAENAAERAGQQQAYEDVPPTIRPEGFKQYGVEAVEQKKNFNGLGKYGL